MLLQYNRETNRSEAVRFRIIHHFSSAILFNLIYAFLRDAIVKQLDFYHDGILLFLLLCLWFWEIFHYPCREIVVQFNADVADGMPWKFVPTQREVLNYFLSIFGHFKVMALFYLLFIYFSARWELSPEKVPLHFILLKIEVQHP